MGSICLSATLLVKSILLSQSLNRKLGTRTRIPNLPRSFCYASHHYRRPRPMYIETWYSAYCHDYFTMNTSDSVAVRTIPVLRASTTGPRYPFLKASLTNPSSQRVGSGIASNSVYVLPYVGHIILISENCARAWAVQNKEVILFIWKRHACFRGRNRVARRVLLRVRCPVFG